MKFGYSFAQFQEEYRQTQGFIHPESFIMVDDQLRVAYNIDVSDQNLHFAIPVSERASLPPYIVANTP